MTRLLITIRTTDDPTAPDALTGFPFIGEQAVIDEMCGDACVVEIDLAGRDDTTAAQEQYLNTNPAVISYSIEPTDLHNEQ
jgi:hypothetical protein